jgi:hypothetical protein
MNYRKTASDIYGSRIKRGDTVCYVNPYTSSVYPPVEVIDIFSQGANGTRLIMSKPPNPEFPHHMGCRASEVKKIPK